MVNRMILHGRLTASPELKITGDLSRCTFCVAWSEKYRDNERKLFLECIAWRKTAETIAEYFAKGQEIVVEGKLNTESWQSKDGSKHSMIRMNVDSFDFCGPKQAGDAAEPAVTAPAQGFVDMDFSEADEDLPFDQRVMPPVTKGREEPK